MISGLFNGSLPSLRVVSDQFVRTELPWRKVVNFTSFTLARTPPGAVSVGQFLDLFEGAGHLREVSHFLRNRSGRWKKLSIGITGVSEEHGDRGGCGSSVLLDHLLIPVWVELKMRANLLSSPIREHLSRSLDNFKNSSNSTAIKLYLSEFDPHVEFSGPSGQVEMIATAYREDWMGLVFESLARVDTSGTERVGIDRGNPMSGNSVHRALLPMADLGTLTLFECNSLHVLI